MTSFADPGGGQLSGDDSRDVQVNLNADVSGYTQQIGAAQQATMGLAGSIDKVLGGFDRLAKFAGRKLFHFAAADFAGLSGAIADAASLEHQLGTLRATSVVTGTSMSTMKDQLDKAFTTMPVARRDLVALTETVTNLGVTKPKDAVAATTTYTKLGAATGESSQALATGSLQLNRMMGNTDPGSVDKYANSLLVVSKNQGVAATSVLEFAQSIAPMARAAGIGQAAVTGIATAFTKVGADGAYAANTFNSIITDITRLAQTNSPELGKYANFVGKKTEDFRQESGTNQITQVFAQIAKGGPRANSFVEGLGLSQRAVGTVQAVAQSGGLDEAIAQARGGTGDTKALDDASKAAFGGLTNSITEVVNMFTKLGEMIGEPFLKPLTLAVEAFGKLLSMVNSVVKALGPIPAILATIVGAAAIPVGLALSHSAGIATLAAGKMLFGKDSMPRISAAEGRTAGAAVYAGATPKDAMRATKVGTLVDDGTANMRQRIPFMYGMQQAQKDAAIAAYGGTPPVGIGGRFRNVGLRGVGAVAGAGTWLANTTSEWNRWSTVGGLSRPPNIPGAPRSPGLIESMKTGSVTKLAGATVNLMGSTVQAGASLATGAAGIAASATTAATAAAIKAAASGIGAGRLMAMMPSVPTPVVDAARGLGKGAMGALGGLLSNPLFMIGTMIAVPVISAVSSSIKKNEEKRKDVSQALSGARPYDQAMDKTSSNLARFGNSVDDAAKRLDKFANIPIKDVTTVTQEDVNAASASGYKGADPKLPNVIAAAKAQKNPDDAIMSFGLNYLTGIAAETGPPKGDDLTKQKQDMLNAVGWDPHSQALVTRMMEQHAARQTFPTGTPQPNPDFELGGLQAGAAGARPQDIDRYKDVLGTQITALGGATQNLDKPGQLAKMINLAVLGGASTAAADQGQLKRQDAASIEIGQAINTDPKELSKLVTLAGPDDLKKNKPLTRYPVLPTQSTFSNETDAKKAWAAGIAASPGGKAALENLGVTPEQYQEMVLHPPPMPTAKTVPDTATKTLREKGPLGVWAAGDAGVKEAAYGSDRGDPQKESQAVMKLVTQASAQAGGDTIQMVKNLQTLSDDLSGVSDPMGAIAKKAQLLGEQMQNFKNPDLSREDQLAGMLQMTKNSAEIARRPHATQESQDEAAAKLQESEAGKESYKETMVGRLVAAKQFLVSRKRADIDNTTQRDRSNRDFATQQGYAKEEYVTQRGRAVDEYTTQQGRSKKAYGVQVGRAKEEFTIQQGYAKDDYTTQRRRSEEEFGIQSVQAEKDYHTQRMRAQEDYGIARTRAVEDNNTQILRSQQDFQLQSLRAQEDYQTSTDRATADHMKDLKRQGEAAAQTIYDPFARIQVKATTDAGTLIYNLKEQNDNIAKQMNEIKELKAKGVSQQTIDTLKLGDAENAQQVSALDQSLTQNPEMAKQINAQISTRVSSTKKLTQDPSNNVAFRQGEEDFRQSMTRGSEDFSKSQKRASADHSLTMKHLAEDFTKTQKHSAEDQAKTLKHMSEDFDKNQKIAADAQTRTLKHMGEDFDKAEKKASAAQALALKHMGEDFTVAQQNAGEDETKALKHMDADYNKSKDHAIAQHKTALEDMAKDYTKVQNQAAEDLAASMIQYSGSFESIMKQLTDIALGDLKKFAPAATAIIIDANTKITAAMPKPLDNLVTASLPPGSSPPGTGAPTVGTLGPNYNIPQGPTAMNAHGGISLTRQLSIVGEHGPELHLPLNSRGENFLTGLIAKSLAGGITTATSGGPAAASTCNDNSISFAGAEIQVVSQDPNQMARELAAKAKLARLASPVRH